MQYRQINELFNSQQVLIFLLKILISTIFLLKSTVQSFILKQFPSKEPVISSFNHLYHPPQFQLTYDQLQCLTSNSLFIQFCNEINLNQPMNHIGIRQFLNKLSTWTDIHQIQECFFSVKKTRRKQIK